MKTHYQLIRQVTMLVLLALVIAPGMGCDSNPVKPIVQTERDFPNTEGSVWKYASYSFSESDSANSTTDSFTITITGSTIVDSTGARVYTREFRSLMENSPIRLYQPYVIEVPGDRGKDTLKTYFRPGDVSPGSITIIPLAVGSGWTCVPCSGGLLDSSYVVDTTTVTVPAGVFSGSFEITRWYNCGDECGAITTAWVKRGVGVVKSQTVFHDIMNGPGVSKTTIIKELLDYHIAPE